MKKILIIEDDHRLSESVATALRKEGYACEFVYDGQMAMKYFLNDAFALILLDLNLPKLNGIDLCKKIRETNSNIPILIITAFGDIDSKMEVFNLGADDYQVKPIHLQELSAKVKIFLKRAEQATIIDNVAEAVAGMNANNAVKIFGPGLDQLDQLAEDVLNSIKDVPGIKDAGILRNAGQPEIQVRLHDHKMALYGVTTADAQAVIEMAIGGKTASVMYEGERKFDIRLRFPYAYRRSEEEIRNILVPTLNGSKVALREIASITSITGPAFIYRDNNSRFIGVKFTVRERDLGSMIKEAQQEVLKKVTVPQGYTVNWTGEFENQVRATKRLSQVVPLSLAAIFVLLFITFGNAKDAGLVLINVPFALIGGILALHITGINFGISAGVGFIALFGICVQNGVILISEFNENLKKRMSLNEAIAAGIRSRTRPVVMTAMMASIGLLPAAISTGIGSESQKPLAIVIIGGLITATILILLIFPIFYEMFNRDKRRTNLALPEADDASLQPDH